MNVLANIEDFSTPKSFHFDTKQPEGNNLGFTIKKVQTKEQLQKLVESFEANDIIVLAVDEIVIN